MPKKERPLPKPPKSPFGKGRFEESREDAPLMADRMAAAMAEGRLEEFMKKEMPDNEYARSLAAMMMGMTGMMPATFSPPVGEEAEGHGRETEAVNLTGEQSPATQPPEDVIRAVHAGDVKGVMELLAREHKKRMPEAESGAPDEASGEAAAGLGDGEKETLNQLMKIASENSVSIDWIVSRALRVYVSEYQKTGRL
jgi:hypothetical protein